MFAWCGVRCGAGALSYDGGEYVAAVLKSGAPEAAKVAQLRGAGIHGCTAVFLLSELFEAGGVTERKEG